MDEMSFNPFVLETLREDLAENCGNRIFLFTCCCNMRQPIQGVVTEVGRDFVQLAVGSTIMIIPLERVIAFRAPSDSSPKFRCSTRLIFRNKLQQFVGQCVTVPWCNCDQILIPDGTLGEIGINFLELRHVRGTNEDLILSFQTVCSVIVNGGTACPTTTMTPTMTPTPTHRKG